MLKNAALRFGIEKATLEIFDKSYNLAIFVRLLLLFEFLVNTVYDLIIVINSVSK